MLRITTITTDGLVLKLEGRLVGPWVEELRASVLRTNWECKGFEIDVTDLIFVDEDGEAALSWLHSMGARFRGKSASFSQYLFERLKIPLCFGNRISRNE